MGNNETIGAFEELVKTLQITEVSDLYLLLTMTNHTKFINHTSINNMGSEVFIHVCKTTASIDNLVNNNYLEIFLLLRHVLKDNSTSKSVIKYSCVPNNIYNIKR